METEELFNQLEKLVIENSEFVNIKIHQILEKPNSETFVLKAFEIAEVVAKFLEELKKPIVAVEDDQSMIPAAQQQQEQLTLYKYVLNLEGNAYYF